MAGSDPVLLDSLRPLVAALRAEGRRVIAPTVRDGAIVLAEIASAADLPHGWGATLAAGSYRLERRADRAAFGHTAGQQSWKTWLRPPRVPLWSARREPDGTVTVAEPPPSAERYAFLGVRPCDLRAIAAQRKVLAGGRFPDAAFEERCRDTFVVAVHCTEPGATCFCVSAGGGPRAGTGCDIALTELPGPRYLAEGRSAAGERLLAALPHRSPDDRTVHDAYAAVDAARDRMGRALPPGDLRRMLADRVASEAWDAVADRCLSCGNCTMVCPTCFCTSVEDVTDLDGTTAHRTMRWDSCFDLDFSYLHGGPVRTSTRSRYRQWLTHKLGTWHDQFGDAGCVGCGRCVVWCPAGIDITAETTALAGSERDTP
jgi:ferredoxin